MSAGATELSGPEKVLMIRDGIVQALNKTGTLVNDTELSAGFAFAINDISTRLKTSRFRLMLIEQLKRQEDM